VKYWKLSLVPFILIFLTTTALFYGISLYNDFYNWTYLINYLVGGILGYTIIRGKKLLIAYFAGTLILVTFNQLYPEIGVNYVSIILTVIEFSFGKYLGMQSK
jgi:hypothetical protein